MNLRTKLLLAAFLSTVTPACMASTAAAATLNPPHDGAWHWFQSAAGAANQTPPYALQCMDQSYTGIGISIPPVGGSKVLFLLDGGGLCYDATSCANRANLLSVAAFVLPGSSQGVPPTSGVPFVARTSYSTGDFLADIYTNTGEPANGIYTWSKPRLMRGVFDRTNPILNPFWDWTFVFLPYCSGDLHVGNKAGLDTTSGLGARTPSGALFHGYSNTVDSYTLALNALTAGLIPIQPTAVVLSGGSAGGFGAVYTYSALRSMVSPSVKITLIDDGGDPLWTGTAVNPGPVWGARPGFLGKQGTQGHVSFTEDLEADAWNLDSVFPASLQYSTPGSLRSMYPIQNVFIHDATLTPTDTFASIDSTNDWLYSYGFPLNFGQPSATPPVPPANPNLAGAQSDFVTFAVNSHANTRFFPVSNTGQFAFGLFPWNNHHTFLGDDVSAWGSPTATPPGSGLGAMLASLGITP